MQRHPQALPLALLLNAGKLTRGLEYGVYEVLNRATELAGWTEERKADLYATLAERLNSAMPLIEIERVADRALWDNENWWAGR